MRVSQTVTAQERSTDPSRPSHSRIQPIRMLRVPTRWFVTLVVAGVLTAELDDNEDSPTWISSCWALDSFTTVALGDSISEVDDSISSSYTRRKRCLLSLGGSGAGKSRFEYSDKNELADVSGMKRKQIFCRK
ncbi:hypothetical protein BT96DRAFT_927154 [Gymnopus androsaceus JB14]|uniref:Uncharacterized protein n=1 Tax=Gymnopus androsaceus JB14 TaxID=1447944 RepID=A0A6A4GST9_9AGAR|nr:hypothetical protein BT96DRAFT_927154 [Gymnopus androsaceus JB14]